jgi:hypothetical protein
VSSCARRGCRAVATEIVGMDGYCAPDAMAERVAVRERVAGEEMAQVLDRTSMADYELVVDGCGEPVWLVNTNNHKRWRVGVQS